MALLPIPGSALSAKFSSPYEILDCLSDTDYVISTLERQRKRSVSHINMLKQYNIREGSEAPVKDVSSSSALIVAEFPIPSNGDDGLKECYPSYQSARLPNSETSKTVCCVQFKSLEIPLSFGGQIRQVPPLHNGLPQSELCYSFCFFW